MVYSVLHSTEPTAFHGLFLYLEDRFIVMDKSEMWKCICAVAHKSFDLFLSVKAEKVAPKFGFLVVMLYIFITK